MRSACRSRFSATLLWADAESVPVRGSSAVSRGVEGGAGACFVCLAEEVPGGCWVRRWEAFSFWSLVLRFLFDITLMIPDNPTQYEAMTPHYLFRRLTSDVRCLMFDVRGPISYLRPPTPNFSSPPTYMHVQSYAILKPCKHS